MYIPEITDNRLKPQLEELVYIAKKIFTETNEEDRLDLIFYFESPATESEINKGEKALNTTLPQGYKDFLRFSNGAQLCGHTAEFDSISKVMNNRTVEMEEGFPEDYIIIADIIGDGEVLCFSSITKRFIRLFEGKETVYDDFYSFFDWLIRFIKRRAEEYVEL